MTGKSSQLNTDKEETEIKIHKGQSWTGIIGGLKGTRCYINQRTWENMGFTLFEWTDWLFNTRCVCRVKINGTTREHKHIRVDLHYIMVLQQIKKRLSSLLFQWDGAELDTKGLFSLTCTMTAPHSDQVVAIKTKQIIIKNHKVS